MFALKIDTANFSAKIYEVAPTRKHADTPIAEVLNKFV